MLLLSGQIVHQGDQFLGWGAWTWQPMPIWTHGEPLNLEIWGCVRRPHSH